MNQQQAEQLIKAVNDHISSLGLAIDALADATWNGDGTDMSVVRYLPDDAITPLLNQLCGLPLRLASVARHKDIYGA